MCTQINNRVLLGGYQHSVFNVNILDRANVSHVVNMRVEALPELVAEQFSVFDCADGETNNLMSTEYWMMLMSWAALAYQNMKSVIYFHARNDNDGTPMACYAGLRAIGYSAIETRRMIEKAHPILNWFEYGTRGVDIAYTNWCEMTGKNPELKRQKMLSNLRLGMLKAHEVVDDSREFLTV